MEISYSPGVYFIRNIKLDKYYIGSSNKIRLRLNDHKNLLRKNQHHNAHLQSSWNLYGKEWFEVGVLEKCSVDDLLKTEQKWLDFIKTEYEVYNAGTIVERPTLGVVSPLLGRKFSDAHKENMAKVRVGQPHPHAGTKLTQKIATDIRNQRALGLSYRKLAKKYGISKSTAFDVVRCRIWNY